MAEANEEYLLDLKVALPWTRKWQPTPVLLPGKFHGLRSLIGYSPWGRKESDMTERLHFHFHCENIDERIQKYEFTSCSLQLINHS